jgi:hypothetical protein
VRGFAGDVWLIMRAHPNISAAVFGAGMIGGLWLHEWLPWCGLGNLL